MDVFISLDEEGFNKLIRGEPAVVITPITDTAVHILLDDIGHARMLTLVTEAMVDCPLTEIRVWARAFGDKKPPEEEEAPPEEVEQQ